MRPYKHVAVIGVDGMGNFNKFASTPNMDRIFADGAVTYDALSLDPTISAENWGAMLLGADPMVHGLTNGYISEHRYTNDKLPSAFRIIRGKYPDAVLVSCCNWNPINYGIVEEGLGVLKTTADNDELVCDQILDALDSRPEFLFVQFDDVDGAGHSGVYGQPKHIKQIELTDGLIGKIYAKYEALGIIDDTLFIVTADRGGRDHGRGGYSDGEKYVFLGCAGRHVPHGTIGEAYTRDISAIVLTALGIDVPAYTPGGYTSQVPSGVFDFPTDDYISVVPAAPVEVKEGVPFDAPGGLAELFGADRFRTCLFFDDDLTDASGKAVYEQSGPVKFYSNGVMGSTAEFGATGAISTDAKLFEGDFTACFWVEASPDIEDHVVLFGNRRWGDGLYEDAGLCVTLRNHSIKLNIGKGIGCGTWDCVAPFDSDVKRGFFHVVVSFDMTNSKASFWYDFRKVGTISIDPSCSSFASAGERVFIGDDSAQGFNSPRGLLIRMDDFMILDGTFNDADVEKLRGYYV